MKKKLTVLGRLTDMTFSVTLFRAQKFKYQKHVQKAIYDPENPSEAAL